MKFTVYALFDPRNNLPFYVGYTSNSKGREQCHLAPNAYKSAPKKHRAKLLELAKAGVKPVFFTIGFAKTKEEALELEQDYIKQAKELGLELSNTQETVYGRGVTPPEVYKPTVAEIDKMRLDSVGLDIIDLYLKLRGKD